MDRASILAARASALASRPDSPLSRVNVIVGPPCSGKSTYVAEHAGPADVVVDFDVLAVAAGSRERWDHGPFHRVIALAARDAMISRFLRGPGSAARMWVILTSRSQIEPLGLSGASLRVIDASIEECLRRAEDLGRTPAVLDAIRSWNG